MDEQTKRRILMDDETKKEVLLYAHRSYGREMGYAGGSSVPQGWYSDGRPIVREDKLESYAKGMGDDAVWGLRKFAKMANYSETSICKSPIDKTFEHALAFIQNMPGGGYNRQNGQVLESAIGSNEAALAAVVGSGASNMNFVVITILLTAIDANNTKIQFNACAKESKIPFLNQKSSQRAVNRIIAGFQ